MARPYEGTPVNILEVYGFTCYLCFDSGVRERFANGVIAEVECRCKKEADDE